MLLHHSLLHIIFIVFPVAISSIIIARPGCPERCGSLSIPYPFGVGSNCSLGPSFNIGCDNSSNPSKAYFISNNISGYYNQLMGNSTQILEINGSQIRVKYQYMLALACYEVSGRLSGGVSDVIDIRTTQYTLSDKNWLTSIGCDNLVLGIGSDNESFSGGCVSDCAKRGNDTSGVGFCPNNGNAYSAGNGCCRIPIPRGTTYVAAWLSDLSRNRGRRKDFSCSYAFVEERINDGSQLLYPLSYLNNSTVSILDNPMASYSRVVVLDWRIGAHNCIQAQQDSSTYACQHNTFCHDFFDAKIGGYICHCLKGYHGNPYLIGGCQDIDECVDSETYPCDSNSNCINTLGSFECSCKRGYHGDGMLNGRGCNKLPPSAMIIVSIGLGSGMGFILLLLICFWLHKALLKRQTKIRKDKFFKRNGGLLLQQQTKEGSTFRETKLFLSKELDKATDHFNESRILGQGGQGIVYKGMLSDGKIVAIKKSRLIDEDQLEQFINEVVILSQINHRNVVQMLGCCLETEVPLLVYEFMPNGTLFDLIHDPSSEFPVSWTMRLKIAAEISGDLAYLHSASSIPIYHRDIKSSNILVDEKYIVKVSDFGTSRSVAVDQTHLTTLVKGTFGYLDPEYFQSSQFTEKSDVYSFGVVLVELLTGQRPICMNRIEEERSLATWFLASMETNKVETILDSQLSDKGGNEEAMIGVARLAQRCLNFKGKMRPTMKEVATELESYRMCQVNIASDKDDECRVYEAKAMMITDSEYTWTDRGNDNSVTSSPSSDTLPLMFATV